MQKSKIGILGGGQLGRMFTQEALKYEDDIFVLDPSNEAPCAKISTFIQGDFNDENTVIEFGQNADIITVEIEHVSVKGLESLEKQGKKVIPSSHALGIIQQKQKQKGFFQEHRLPSPKFENVESIAEITFHPPFVQKLNTGGYDGKGVQIIKSDADRYKIWDAPSVIEELVDIDKELSIIIAKSPTGEVSTFPITEMLANEELNLLDFNISPARISNNQILEIELIAKTFSEAIPGSGLFAIELFLDKEGKIYINEVAPRLHNSGHLTQDCCYNSQFEQLYRILKNLPLANTSMLPNIVGGMLNIVGDVPKLGEVEENYSGEPHYIGLEKCLEKPNAYLHLYGKTSTKPGRKMGHINLVATSYEVLQEELQSLKKSISVRTK